MITAAKESFAQRQLCVSEERKQINSSLFTFHSSLIIRDQRDP